jgi:predicted transcriptional regulator YdeE
MHLRIGGRVDVVEKPELTVVGIEVVADFGDLHTAVPAAWRTLFSRQAELPAPANGAFVEASHELGEGRYREVVGVIVDRHDPVPEGMCAVQVPAGRFLHHRHDGPVTDITSGFQAMYSWASDSGLRLGPYKVDVGYRPDVTDRPHDLYIDIVD